MPNPETTQEITNSSLSPESLKKTVKEAAREVISEDDLKREISRIFEDKAKNLSEEGRQHYYEAVQNISPAEGETWQQAINKKDPILKALEGSYPKDGASTEETTEETKTDEESTTEVETKKEPVNQDTEVVVTSDDDDPFKVPEEANQFGTLDDYVNAHNNKYEAKKRINRFSKDLSVNS